MSSADDKSLELHEYHTIFSHGWSVMQTHLSRDFWEHFSRNKDLIDGTYLEFVVT